MSCYQKTLIFATFTCLYFFSAHFTERHLQKISSALKSFCLNVGLWFWLLKLKRSRDRAKWRCCSYLFSALIQECHLGSQAFLMASIFNQMKQFCCLGLWCFRVHQLQTEVSLCPLVSPPEDHECGCFSISSTNGLHQTLTCPSGFLSILFSISMAELEQFSFNLKSASSSLS